MPNKNLSHKQRRILELIEHSIASRGYPPTYRELMQELGYESTGSIYRFIRTLQAKGFLQKSSRSWRNIQPTKTQEALLSTAEVEIIGKIYRHKPPELFQQTILASVPSHFIQQGGSLYGLLIQDTGFLSEHILPHDLLLVEPTDKPTKGELVLASTDQTIIGHFFEEEGVIYFRTSPYTQKGVQTSATTSWDEVQIWGVIVGMIRTFEPTNT